MLKRLVCITLIFFISACAFGRAYDYHLLSPEYQGDVSKSITVIVSDQRPYIINGDKEADFVGLQRGGYGNSFDVTTETGNSLSYDLRHSIETSFLNKGASLHMMKQESLVSKDDAYQMVENPSADRVLLLELLEWKSDIMIQSSLIYTVKVSLYNRNGKKLSEKTFSANDVTGRSFWNPAGSGERSVMAHAKKVLEEILNDPIIKEHL